MKIVFFSLLVALLLACSPRNNMPNIIFILTDDQGYGDLSHHGNPWLQTPNMDKIAEQGIVFDNFHVGTTCAPTRGGLMTGRYCNRVGVWHTVMGRHFPRRDEVTLAEVFQQAGYATGMFGKWHLGDNSPYLPHERGFDTAFYHGGGGVGQIPDYWNNDYFNDTYFRNGAPESVDGYCTDVWFREALTFIENHQNNPFFCYLSTNAPHSPFHVPQTYLQRFQENPSIANPNFYGMIANLDDNIAILEEKLQELELSENTILIFMTDNGTSAGVNLDGQGFPRKGYNAGMRGKKGSKYDGGHRVPFFLRWPRGDVLKSATITEITSYVDVMPTLLDLCGIEVDSIQFDGKSLKPLMTDETPVWAERVLFTDTQRIDVPRKWKDSAAMTDRWRLIDGKELYDMENDPGQTRDVSDDFPEVVSMLREEYEQWWESTSTHFDETSPIPIGHQNEPVLLTSHDLHTGNDLPPWHQIHVRNATGGNGFWFVNIAVPGRYKFSLHRWPPHLDHPLDAGLPEHPAVPGGAPLPAGKALAISHADLHIRDWHQKIAVNGGDVSADFVLELNAGPAQLYASLISSTGEDYPVYYVTARRLNDE